VPIDSDNIPDFDPSQHRKSDALPLASQGRDTAADEKASLWSRIQQNIKDRLGTARYSIWFTQTELMHMDDTQVVVGVPNIVIQQYLQQRYAGRVAEAVEDLLGRRFSVTFDVAPRLFRRMRARQERAAAEAEQTRPELDFRPDDAQSALDSSEGFECLVETESNRLPYAAAREIAAVKEPRISLLLVWGEYGSGKSALLNAVRHAAAASGNYSKIECTTAESWCNKYVYSLWHNKTMEFRRRYRGCDLLILDDIHFLDGKRGTQNELLHTIKSLLESGRRIVLSSARHPHELKELRPALKTVLTGAFWVKLVHPSLEERETIVRKLAERSGLNATAEVYRFIANANHRSLRELRGAVNSLAAYAALMGNPKVDLQVAMKGLSAMCRSKKAPPTLGEIAGHIVEVLSVEREHLLGRSRSRGVCKARQIGMYLARELTDATLCEIGRFFGGRSHSTVKHAVAKITRCIQDDRNIALLIDGLKNKLRSL